MAQLSSQISENEARQLHQNWVNTRAKIINGKLGTTDPYEFLFDAKELLEFVQQVIEQSEHSKPGIRIYFGAYVADSGENQATVFLSPAVGSTLGAANDYSMRPMNKGMRGLPPMMY